MAIQSEFFSTSFGIRSFSSTKHIATKQHMAVWLKKVSDDLWTQLSVNKFELINNSAVLTEVPSSILYSKVEIRVADEPDELGSSQSEITVLAGLYDEIVALNGIKNDITTVADISGDVTTVSSNISDINSVVTNIVPNLNEILQADTKATEASASATQALGYRNEAEAFSISNVFVVPTIEGLVTIPSNYTTAIVKDLDRGGTFIWSSTGTANGGTVFAGSTGYWNRQYSGAVNVKWFGAKGDGINDDTEAIQLMVETADIDTTFIFPEGTYLIGEGTTTGYLLLLPSNVKFKGIGRPLFKVIDHIPNVAGSVFSVLGLNGENITIDGIDIDCNYSNQDQTSTMIGIGGTSACHNITIKNMDINNAFYAIQTNLSQIITSKFFIQNVSLYNNYGRGIRVRYTKDVVAYLANAVFNLRSDMASSSYFEVSGSSNVRATGGNVYHTNSTEGVGFRVVNGSSNVSISNGVVENGLHTIFATDSENVIFNNIIGSNSTTAIRCGQSNIEHYLPAKNIVFNNIILNNILYTGLDCSIMPGFTDGVCTVKLTNSYINVADSAVSGIQVGGQNNGEMYVTEFNNTITSASGLVPLRLGAVDPIDRIKTDYVFSAQATIANDMSHFFPVKEDALQSGVIEVMIATQGIVGAFAFRTGASKTMEKVWSTSAGTTYFNILSGALTGTTGADNKINISADTKGIWIENRLIAKGALVVVTFTSMSGNIIQ